jgi:hypothetical protein
MQIKTIREQHILSKSFDDMVNEALAEGWQLTRRTVINDKLYAELVMPDEPQPREPLDWKEAVNALRDMCGESPCLGCPARNWCVEEKWKVPKDWEARKL